MALAYTPPGVSVSETVSPNVAPLLAVPASVCLVGLAGNSATNTTDPGGVITKTELVTLTGTTPAALSVPADATMQAQSSSTVGAIKKVTDYYTPSITQSAGYAYTTDWTFNNTAKTITRVGGGTIPSGATVAVTYTYTPADYWKPIRLSSLADIEERFGKAWNSTGTGVFSPLSFAAMHALENGASDIVLQPLFFDNAGTKQQPTDAQHATTTPWVSTLTQLRDYEDINIVVPIIGQSQTSVDDSVVRSIAFAVQDHLKFMKSEQQYIIGIFGNDATTNNITNSLTTPRDLANQLQGRYNGELSEQCVVLAPSKFVRAQPNTFANTVNVGGQYAAAAIAGMIASRPVSASLTRRGIAGFVQIGEVRTKSDKNTDAQNGLMVVEQRGSVVQVRHAVTIDNTSTVKRELSIVRAKHRVVESIRSTIEEQIIGRVVADGQAPLVVRNAIVGTLDLLRGQGDIVSFNDVQARYITLDPTTVEVRFSYKPAFPLNYVNVVFSLDLTTGDVTLPTSNTTF